MKNVPDELLDAFRERARRNRRSLQGELLDILHQSVLPSRLTIEDIYERMRRMGLRTGRESASIVREDRDADR